MAGSKTAKRLLEKADSSLQDLARRAVKTSEKRIEEAFDMGWNRAEAITDTSRKQGKREDRKKEKVIRLVASLIEEATKEFIGKIEGDLKQASEEDKTEKDMRNLVAQRIDQYGNRLDTIVRTETNRAINSGSNALTVAERIPLEIYRTMMDGTVCILCAPLEGQTYRIGQGPNPPGDLHPNCRCRRDPVI